MREKKFRGKLPKRLLSLALVVAMVVALMPLSDKMTVHAESTTYTFTCPSSLSWEEPSDFEYEEDDDTLYRAKAGDVLEIKNESGLPMYVRFFGGDTSPWDGELTDNDYTINNGETGRYTIPDNYKVSSYITGLDGDFDEGDIYDVYIQIGVETAAPSITPLSSLTINSKPDEYTASGDTYTVVTDSGANASISDVVLPSGANYSVAKLAAIDCGDQGGILAFAIVRPAEGYEFSSSGFSVSDSNIASLYRNKSGLGLPLSEAQASNVNRNFPALNSSAKAGDAVICWALSEYVGDMTVTSTDGTATYDGNATSGGATVNVTNPSTGYTIAYGMTEGTYDLSNIPTYTEVGKYTVYYKVTADGYNDYTGSFAITISEEEINPGKEQVVDTAKATTSTPDTEITSIDVEDDIALSEDEKAAIEYGKDVNVFLEVNDSTVTKTAQTAIASKAADSSYKVGKYIDIDLYSMIVGDDSSKRAITETANEIEISVAVPTDLINTDANVERTYAIARLHDGKADILPATFDAKTGKLAFKTNLFSSYAIVYKDTAKTPETKVTDNQSANQTTTTTVQTTTVQTTTAQTTVPATGDARSLALCLILMAEAAICMVECGIFSRRKKDKI